jgi:hypothetical protein
MAITLDGTTGIVTPKWTVSGNLAIGDGSVASPSLTNIGDSDTGVYFPSANTVAVATGGVQRILIDSAGNMGIGTSSPTTKLDVVGTVKATTLQGTVDGTNSVGFKNIPPVGTKTASYTLTTGDVGKYVQLGTSGAIVIPDATFAEGDAVVIFNNTSGNITITCTITTAYIAGTDADKATVTLATRGVANIFFISGTVCVITGNVS